MSDCIGTIGMTEANVESVSEGASKAQYAFLGVLGAAIISAAVSFFVSKNTTEVEMLKIQSAEHATKAEQFKNLVKEISSGGSGSEYALIALWKIYPNDHRLILVTALQNPTKKSLNTLRAIVPRGGFDEYSDSIESLMYYADPEERVKYAEQFIDVTPESVLRVYLDLLQSTTLNDAFEHGVVSGELVRLLADKIAIQSLFDEMLQEIDINRNNSVFMASASLSLVKVGYARAWRRYMENVLDSQEVIAGLVLSSDQYKYEFSSILKSEKLDQLLPLQNASLEFIRDVCTKADVDSRSHCIAGAEFYSALNDGTSTGNDKKFVTLVENHVMNNENYTHSSLLEILSEYDPKIAKKAFYYLIGCGAKPELAYRISVDLLVGKDIGISNFDEESSESNIQTRALGLLRTTVGLGDENDTCSRVLEL